MATKKRRVSKEPFLNVFARKLGGAAGTLTRTSRHLAENLADVPENITIKVQEAVDSFTPAKRTSVRAKRRKKQGTGPARARVASRIAAKKTKRTVRGNKSAVRSRSSNRKS